MSVRNVHCYPIWCQFLSFRYGKPNKGIYFDFLTTERNTHQLYSSILVVVSSTVMPHALSFSFKTSFIWYSKMIEYPWTWYRTFRRSSLHVANSKIISCDPGTLWSLLSQRHGETNIFSSFYLKEGLVKKMLLHYPSKLYMNSKKL